MIKLDIAATCGWRAIEVTGSPDRRIAEMWLACYTEEEIAEAVGTGVQPVKDAVSDKNAIWQKNLIFSNYQEPGWQPPLYDVWRAAKKSNDVSHFGNSEARGSWEKFGKFAQCSRHSPTGAGIEGPPPGGLV